jgi:hypothetical protein
MSKDKSNDEINFRFGCYNGNKYGYGNTNFDEDILGDYKYEIRNPA